MKITFPKNEKKPEELLAELRTLSENDPGAGDHCTQRSFFVLENETDFIARAYQLFFWANGLSPGSFPSLRKFESETIAMLADLFGGDGEVTGNLTTSITESAFMVVKAARERARKIKPQITQAELLLGETASPDFLRAAQLLNLQSVRVPAGADMRVDVATIEKSITNNTIMLVASSPTQPHGVLDPIKELAEIAQKNDIHLHVDASAGGFMLPFLEKSGLATAPYDFRTPGVTSISLDLKYRAFGPGNSGVILYRNGEIRKHQFFSYADWTGGVYGSPSLTGSRAGGPIAASWAVLNHLGVEGYTRIFNQVMKQTRKLIEGINEIPGMKILGNPVASTFAITSDTRQIPDLVDALKARGQHTLRQKNPDSMRLTVTPDYDDARVDGLLLDLRECTQK